MLNWDQKYWLVPGKLFIHRSNVHRVRDDQTTTADTAAHIELMELCVKQRQQLDAIEVQLQKLERLRKRSFFTNWLPLERVREFVLECVRRERNHEHGYPRPRLTNAELYDFDRELERLKLLDTRM